MTERPIAVSEEDLQAFVDGRLPAERAPSVEGYLAARPEEAERVAAYRDQNDLLRDAFGALPEDGPPERLVAAVSGRPRHRTGLVRWAGFGWRTAAAVLLLAVGAAGGWWLRESVGPRGESQRMAELASQAHRIYAAERRHPVEVGSNQEAHLVGWLSKRLGQDITVFDFSSQGFRLIGGRMLPAGGLPAAQFMYERADGRRITCFVTVNPAGGETAFRTLERDGTTAFYWLDGPLGYAMVGDLGREELLRLAHLAYGQLEP